VLFVHRRRIVSERPFYSLDGEEQQTAHIVAAAAAAAPRWRLANAIVVGSLYQQLHSTNRQFGAQQQERL